MKRWKPEWLMLLGAALLTAAIVVLAESALVRVLGLVLFACGGFGVHLLRKRHEQNLREQHEQQVESVLEMLQNRRHDWLNDLQLVYAYVKMKKYDRLSEAIRALVEKMEVESRAARLDAPELTLFLHHLATEGSKFKLAVETDEKVRLRQLPEPVRRAFCSAMVEAVQALKKNVQESETYGTLPLLTIRFNTRDQLLIGGLYLDGCAADIDRLGKDCEAIRKKLRQDRHKRIRLFDVVKPHRTEIEISVPLQT